MSKTSSAGLTPQTETEAKTLVLCAVIKASSKYAYQGRENGKPVAMRVTWLESSDYAFHLENGNRKAKGVKAIFVSSGKLLEVLNDYKTNKKRIDPFGSALGYFGTCSGTIYNVTRREP